MTAPITLGTTRSEAAETLSRQIAPSAIPTEQPRWAQSLAKGAAGIALLHIERAHTSAGSWQIAHDWMKAATREEISAANDAGLYFGVPAIAFVLHTARADGTERYGAALPQIDTHVDALAHRRVDLALTRINHGRRPAFAEYDLLHGLTGIGAHLLAHTPDSEALGRILAYLVRLTEPLRAGGHTLPGWWTLHGPDLKTPRGFPGGHANFGMAHGITGPLALLAQAMRAGITVDRHADAIHTICAFLDAWRQDGDTGSWWPQWITLDDLHTGRPSQPGPARPSWCYGTPGIARAQQLAAIATGDIHRRHIAEHALAASLADPAQLSQLVDTSLCHGWAGLYQTALRAARDALSPLISERLPYLTEMLIHHATAAPCQAAGLLEGRAGTALALHTAARAEPPNSGWDTCLMIN
ncbi:lanthionine synthetase C family protein [Actinomadura miaoliensis]|uniref:Lanthionine synthetase C family protein n=1 Tax=Actinomadura miaoliensis TaxID=430685 RepID=A0ABP7X0C9_9ACTN